MRISDWSSDVCSSDLIGKGNAHPPTLARAALPTKRAMRRCRFLAQRAPISLRVVPAKIGEQRGNARGGLHRHEMAMVCPKFVALGADRRTGPGTRQIGKAACMEREGQYG